MGRKGIFRAARCILLLALLFLLLPSANPLGQGSRYLSLLSVDDTQFPLVEAIATLSDDFGFPIMGKTDPSLWLIREDTASADIIKVEEVTGDRLPLSLAFVVDVSGSMAGIPLEKTGASAKILVETILVPADRVALVTFSTDVDTRVPLTEAHEDLLRAWPVASEGQYTHLYDALKRAIEELRDAPAGKRAILLFSDGEDIGSSLTLEDVVTEARMQAIPIYIIGYGASQHLKPDVLKRLATRTGGIALIAANPDDIPGQFQKVFSILRSAYIIAYLSNSSADDARHELLLTFSESGWTGETRGYVTARRGNFQVTLEARNLPAREIAERVWQAMGQAPVGEDIPYFTGRVDLVPASPQPGKLVHASFYMDDVPIGDGTGDGGVLPWDSSTASPGLHSFKVRAQDHVGNQAEQELTAAVIPPAYPAFISLQPGVSVTGTVPVKIEVTAVDVVSEIALFANDIQLDRQTPPAGNFLSYEYPWNVQQVPEGDYRLRVEVKTAAGLQSIQEIPIHVGPHVVVDIQSPADQAEVKGNVNVAVKVDSDAPVSSVRCFVDDGLVGESTTVPYQFRIDTRNFPPKQAIIRVEGTNVYGFTGGASVQVKMIPGSTAGPPTIIFLVVVALALAIFPVVWITLRRRTSQQRKRALASRGKETGQPSTSASGGIVGWLVGEQGPLSNQRFPLRSGETRVGRDPNFADLVIKDPRVSRRHARIMATSQGLMFYNQNEHNPSMVNGRPVSQMVPLHHGDRIQIGDSVFRVQLSH